MELPSALDARWNFESRAGPCAEDYFLARAGVDHSPCPACPGAADDLQNAMSARAAHHGDHSRLHAGHRVRRNHTVAVLRSVEDVRRVLPRAARPWRARPRQWSIDG